MVITYSFLCKNKQECGLNRSDGLETGLPFPKVPVGNLKTGKTRPINSLVRNFFSLMDFNPSSLFRMSSRVEITYKTGLFFTQFCVTLSQ